jgi:hypothetical protein
MRRRSLRVGASVVAVMGVGVVLAGCSSTPTPDLDLPAQNQARWVQPLDQYTPADTIAADYAENLLMQPCMEKRGFDWNVPWRDVAAGPSETSSDAGRKLFTVEIARRYGYRSGPNPDSGIDAWLQFMEQELSDAKVAAIDECIAEARETLPLLPGETQLAMDLTSAAFNGALEDPDVADAARAWHECMADSGIPDLPDEPIGIPSDYMVKTFGLDQQQTASAEEIRVATLDAACRESSGYASTFYQEEWSRQVTLLADNADALERLEEVIAANRVAVYDVISSHAPRAPG